MHVFLNYQKFFGHFSSVQKASFFTICQAYKTALKQNLSFEMQAAAAVTDICFPLCLLEIAIYGFIG